IKALPTDGTGGNARSETSRVNETGQCFAALHSNSGATSTNPSKRRRTKGCDIDFKISIAGPASVGKTSLIASMVEDLEEMLEESIASDVVEDQGTKRRLDRQRKKIESQMRAGQFSSGQLGEPKKSFSYEFRLDSGVDGGIRFGIRDGLADWTRGDQDSERWLMDSSVLVIPVDSTAVMTPSEPKYYRLLPKVLRMAQVQAAAHRWATGRAQRSHEPALLLFCPLKCESYVGDSDELARWSESLFHGVIEVYRPVLDAAYEQLGDRLIVAYSPVHTMGCVEVIGSHWQDVRFCAYDPNATNGQNEQFDESVDPDAVIHSSDYCVQPPGEREIDGAMAVFVLLCKHILAGRSQLAEKLSQEGSSLENDPRWKAILAQGFTKEIHKLIAMDTKALASLDPNRPGDRFDINALVETISRLPDHVFSRWVQVFSLK
ncbi:MAG: hypothetical protein FWD57_17000, partial [Polyangiaceae bacterium]|nr:hypothetical protein [Polyangiaceae bacterium]